MSCFSQFWKQIGKFNESHIQPFKVKTRAPLRLSRKNENTRRQVGYHGASQKRPRKAGNEIKRGFPQNIMRFQRHNRVRLARDFEHLKKNSAKVDCSAFVFYVLVSEDADRKFSRFAAVAGKRTGNAVQRNKIRRIFREIFRAKMPHLPRPCDILVFARKNALSSDFAYLKEKFDKACEIGIKKSEDFLKKAQSQANESESREQQK